LTAVLGDGLAQVAYGSITLDISFGSFLSLGSHAPFVN
jgi:hypothetical protein